MQVTAAANMASPGTGDDATTSYQVLTVTSAEFQFGQTHLTVELLILTNYERTNCY